MMLMCPTVYKIGFSAKMFKQPRKALSNPTGGKEAWYDLVEDSFSGTNMRFDFTHRPKP